MNQDFKEFFALLNARRVDFLVIGGVAYNFYAPPRSTKDIDLWIRPTVENAKTFLTALSDFGFDHDLNSNEFVERDNVLMLGRPPYRIDVLTRPKGLIWEACWTRRVVSDYAGEPIAFLSLEDLIASKMAAGRDQDLVDARKLRAVSERTGPKRQ